MLNNVELFNECLTHKVNNIDKLAHKILNRKVIPNEINEPSELLERNTKLVELLTKYNNYNSSGDNSHNEELINEIDECLDFDGMNMCPFSQYLMVHDLTYDLYMEDLTYSEKEYVIKCYLNDRHQMYLNHEYSDIIFQVMTDNYSHKRKGTLGIEKIKITCKKYGIDYFDGDFDGNYYLLPDNGDKDLFKDALNWHHIDFEFSDNHQGKLPDAFIKYNREFIIVEHKKMKSTGGGQDKQITEIIEFIKNRERGVHFVSYLDGILFNELKDPPSTRKIYRSKMQIIRYLTENEYNYFVNEFGFDKLMDYIVKEKD